jgi:hypothetical protein
LQFTYPHASIKDVQATGEAFSSKKEHPALQNIKFLNFFYFCGSFLFGDGDEKNADILAIFCVSTVHRGTCIKKYTKHVGRSKSTT